MSIVDFNTSIWKDSWFRKLSVKAKNLFIFLWTNDHKNLACIYEIDIDTIGFYTGLTGKDIKNTLSLLYPKVKYDYDNEVVWVVNFVKHQFMRTPKISPKIITGIRNNLVQSNGHFFIKEFLEEYQSLDISFEYPIDTVPDGYQYPPGGGGGEGKGKGSLNIIKERAREAQKILDYLNEITGKEFEDISFITARLNEGKKPEQCITIINNQHKDRYFIENPKLMNPQTLFRPKHWDKYLNNIPHPLHGKVSATTMENIESFKEWKPPK